MASKLYTVTAYLIAVVIIFSMNQINEYEIFKYDRLNENEVIQNSVDISKNECTDSNWLNEMYKIYEPLNNNCFIEYAKMNYNDFKKSPSSYNNVAIILINENKNNLNNNMVDVLKMFDLLAFNSMYIHRIYNEKDINVVQRLYELTNDRCCGPNAWTNVFNYKRYYVFNQFCWKCGCIATKAKHEDISLSEYKKNETFYKLASQTQTDKVTDHQYHHLYGKYLKQFYHQNTGNMLEIGFGCTMDYGPGESAKIWIHLFHNVHFIEVNRKCMKKYQNVTEKASYKVHVGDQSDVLFLEEIKNKYLIQKGLDIVIDDGGHWNKHIIPSFLSFWHMVNVNGMYFIEDYGFSTYSFLWFKDGKKLQTFGEEKPGTTQYFIKSLLENLYCHLLPHKSCYDIKYIESMANICVIGK
eukprot:395412_1